MVPSVSICFAVAQKEKSARADLTGESLNTHGHGKVRDALLDDARPDDLERLALSAPLDLPVGLAVRLLDVAVKEPSLAQLGLLGDHLGHAQRLGVDGRLRDEAVRGGEADDARDKGRAAEEEKVPVEAGRALDGEAARLGHHRARVVLRAREGERIVRVAPPKLPSSKSGWTTHVEVEQERDEEAERKGDKHPLDGEVPERNDPVAAVDHEDRIRS